MLVLQCWVFFFFFTKTLFGYNYRSKRVSSGDFVGQKTSIVGTPDRSFFEILDSPIKRTKIHTQWIFMELFVFSYYCIVITPKIIVLGTGSFHQLSKIVTVCVHYENTEKKGKFTRNDTIVHRVLLEMFLSECDDFTRCIQSQNTVRVRVSRAR